MNFQGTLTGDGLGSALFGRPDFLVRADLLSARDGELRPGGIHYEVVDAKLARSAKARAVLQTSFYSHLLAGVQGVEPRWMHLALGMAVGQRRALKGDGIPTRRGFAGLAELPRLDRVSRDSLERSQLQARLQMTSEDEGVIRYELLDPERDTEGALVANRGLLALPEPADGDLFFDIDGARYYSEDGREFGLQYLFGVVDTAEADEAGLPRYTQIWAYDQAGEKRAFEELIDFITERRARHPDLHVYHYSSALACWRPETFWSTQAKVATIRLSRRGWLSAVGV